MSLLDFIKIVNTVYHGLDINIEQRLSNVTMKTLCLKDLNLFWFPQGN